MNKQAIGFTVDGRDQALLVDTQASLLEVLREDVGVKGVRAGCREGGCGSCSVLVDGQLVLSCLYPVARLDGCAVSTIEGLQNTPSDLHPIQQAFIDNGATQCGFCASGMIMAAQALLAEQPNPTREEVVEAMAGNVCRCTGYQPIIEAVLDAAQSMQETK